MLKDILSHFCKRQSKDMHLGDKISKILILGQPKTGTTGLFYKIKNSLPSNTQCFFEPKKFDPLVIDSRSPVLAKVLFQHNFQINYEDFGVFPKKVLIVRDPRDRMISGLLYSSFKLHQTNRDRFFQFVELLKQKERSPRSLSVQSLLSFRSATSDFKIKLSQQGFLNFYRNHPEYFIFKYEDLIDGKFANLENYLGVCLKGKAIVEKALKVVERTKSYGDWKNWFTEDDVQRYKGIFGDYLRVFGYTDDWRIDEKPRISSRHCSEYVVKLAYLSDTRKQS